MPAPTVSARALVIKKRVWKMGGVAGGGNVHGYNAEFNWVCFFCCLSASAGGALFGYDNGESVALQRGRRTQQYCVTRYCL